MKDRSNAELIDMVRSGRTLQEQLALREIEDRLDRLDAFGNLSPAGVANNDPILKLRRAVHSIWTAVDLLSISPAARKMNELALNHAQRIFNEDRARLHGAAILRGVALGAHYADVAGLCSSYDAGLAILKEATE